VKTKMSKKNKDRIDDMKGKRVKVYQSGMKGEKENLSQDEKAEFLIQGIRSYLADFLLDDKRFNIFDIALALRILNNQHGEYLFEQEQKEEEQEIDKNTIVSLAKPKKKSQIYRKKKGDYI